MQFPASRRKTLFGETPNTTRGDAYAPQTYPNRGLSVRFSEMICEGCSRSFGKFEAVLPVCGERSVRAKNDFPVRSNAGTLRSRRASAHALLSREGAADADRRLLA